MRTRLAKRAATPPDAAASVVLVAARAATRAFAAVRMDWVDPVLKPYQPNHRMKDPRTYGKQRPNRSVV